MIKWSIGPLDLVHFTVKKACGNIGINCFCYQCYATISLSCMYSWNRILSLKLVVFLKISTRILIKYNINYDELNRLLKSYFLCGICKLMRSLRMWWSIPHKRVKSLLIVLYVLNLLLFINEKDDYFFMCIFNHGP